MCIYIYIYIYIYIHIYIYIYVCVWGGGVDKIDSESHVIKILSD